APAGPPAPAADSESTSAPQAGEQAAPDDAAARRTGT
ncbi:hypothetical protein L560_0888, partial [Bordetella pertussis STO1-CHOC-0018]